VLGFVADFQTISHRRRQARLITAQTFGDAALHLIVDQMHRIAPFTTSRDTVETRVCSFGQPLGLEVPGAGTFYSHPSWCASSASGNPCAACKRRAARKRKYTQGAPRTCSMFWPSRDDVAADRPHDRRARATNAECACLAWSCPREPRSRPRRFQADCNIKPTAICGETIAKEIRC
jgi:hypothetical protein